MYMQKYGQGGETQPFYHVAVDERDSPECHATFVAEESLVACDSAFPVQASPQNLIFAIW